LTRVARTGGRAGNGELGELGRQLGRVLAEAALSNPKRQPDPEEAAHLRRLATELSQAETASILLVQAEAGAPELKVRLASSTDKTLREPDLAAPSLGLYLFRSSSREPGAKLLERLSISAPSELNPTRPLHARVDVLATPGSEAALTTRELSLPSDGKALALAP
jgi:hypothetical protein